MRWGRGLGMCGRDGWRPRDPGADPAHAQSARMNGAPGYQGALPGSYATRLDRTTAERWMGCEDADADRGLGVYGGLCPALAAAAAAGALAGRHGDGRA